MTSRKGGRMLRAALLYAEDMGWPVLPLHTCVDGRCSCSEPECKSPGKHPRNQGGVTNATPDPEAITDWFTRWPDANIGVATGAPSGTVALDVDGPGAEEALRELGASIPTLTNVTANGRHVLFKYPGSFVKNRVRLRDQLDVRGDGGYIVVPPSLHASGHRYRWDDEHGMGWGLELAPLPDGVLDALNGSGPAPPIPEVIPEGKRNDTLTSMAGSIRRRGATTAEILAVIRVANTNRCQPPLEDEELKQIADSISGLYKPEPLRTNELNELSGLTGLRAGENYESIRIKSGSEGALFVNSFNSCPSSLSYDGWPEPLGDAAFHGLAGELLQMVAEETEADPAAILTTFLVVAGSFFGRAPHCRVGADSHHTNENLLLIGTTSEGRKGLSFGEALRPFKLVMLNATTDHLRSGLSSGEGLIWAVRDPISKEEPIKDRGRRTGAYETVVVDQGTKDKRLIVLETEFASTLKVMGREGNSLSAVIRQAWETGDLSILTKNTPARATGAHISIIGHCTAEELRRNLNRTEIAAGFMNRFLIVCARRARLLPDGGNLHDGALTPFALTLQERLITGNEHGAEIRRDEHASDRWHEVYERLTTGRPGLMGAITSRATAHVLRLSLIYALLDAADQIEAPHLEAALAVWKYVCDSAAFVFRESLGDPVAETLLQTLREAPDGLTLTDLHGALGRNHSGERINAALGTLEGAGLATSTTRKTGGRPVKMWRVTDRYAPKLTVGAEGDYESEERRAIQDEGEP